MQATVVLAVVVLAATAAVCMLRSMGRVWGERGVWAGANESHTSQRLADPYTFTHVLHGILFYWALSGTSLGLPARFLVALLAELAWEVFENTPWLINRYRTQTVSLGYTGDSILNTTGDVLAMVAGFWLAASAPWQASAAFVGVTELALYATIGDNLTQNIWQLA